MVRRLVAIAVLALLASAPGASRADSDNVADPPVPIVTLDVLPLGVSTAALDDLARARAESVLARSIFAQRVEGIRFRSRETVYRFLLDHPDFASTVARALRLGQYQVLPLTNGYWGDDARGATGMIRVLYADETRRLYHLHGRYQRQFLPTIEGQILVLLEFRHEADAEDGSGVVDQSLTGHVRIDTPIMGGLIQLLGALSRPLVEQSVERKVRRFFGTVARVSRWAHDEPDQLLAALDGHPDVEAGPTLDAFRRLLSEGRPPTWAREPFHLAGQAAARLDAGQEPPEPQ
jgi:hypothetical protein